MVSKDAEEKQKMKRPAAAMEEASAEVMQRPAASTRNRVRVVESFVQGSVAGKKDRNKSYQIYRNVYHILPDHIKKCTTRRGATVNQNMLIHCCRKTKTANG